MNLFLKCQNTFSFVTHVQFFVLFKCTAGFLYILKEPMKAVLGIRDILVRIRIPGFVPLMDPDPCLDPATDPTPDPTSFFIDFKDAKKISFFIFFFL